MNQERLMKVLRAPHVSEKATLLAETANKVVFKVVPDATKPEIKRAVELMFDVKVDDVRVISIKGKGKRFGRFVGRRKNWKKAYVTLKEGYDIDFMGAE